jgi:hypothetical protein
MQRNDESEELNDLLESGYAAPPLDDAFSSNLVRQLQAEVAPQTSEPRSRLLRWALALGGVGVAASILAVLWVLNPLDRKPSRDVAMHSGAGSNDESNSLESSLSLESTQTKPSQANDVEVSDFKTGDAFPLNDRSGKLARPAEIGSSRWFSSRFYLDHERKRSELERESEEAIPDDWPISGVEPERKSNISLSESESFESLSQATMEEIEIVSRERAKALGLSITSQAAGPDAVRVTLEFEKQEELKEYAQVALEQFDGDKLLLSATLKEGEAKPGRIVVGFVVARGHLEQFSLKVSARDASGSRVGYVLPMKDFVMLE